MRSLNGKRRITFIEEVLFILLLLYHSTIRDYIFLQGAALENHHHTHTHTHSYIICKRIVHLIINNPHAHAPTTYR